MHKILTPLLLLCLVPATAAADTSPLWGAEGETWDPRGRLPDYSYAGYHAGRDPIPEIEEVVNVRDTGARPNDGGDDTRAIQRAIDRAAARGGGAVFLPAGRYVISDQLRISDSGVVLRGAGRSATTLYVTRSLADIHGWDLSYANGNSGIIEVGRRRAYARKARVAEAASRGDRWITLNHDARERGIRGGRFIRIQMDATGGDLSLWNDRHNGQNGSPGSQCDDATGELGYWIVRVRSVDGRRVELDQPLRQDIQTRWNPVVDLVRTVREVGVEYLEIEFERRAYRGHHLERGYNGIGFGGGGVVDSWIRNVRIRYADNGLDLRRSKHVTVDDVVLTGGRPGGTYDGHHGVTLGIDTLLQDVEINVNFIHEVTFAERTTGSVVSRGSGGRWSLDHHSRAMIENLVTNQRSDYDWMSGGGACRPAAGARNTYWNFRDPIRPPSWGNIQTNVVGELGAGTSARQTRDGRWYERVRSLEPHNLYEAQLSRRLRVEDRGSFSPSGLGRRGAFDERDPSRWAIVRVGDDRRLWLASRAYDARPGGRLGEHALARTAPVGDGWIVGRANPHAGLAERPRSNYALILGYQNERNYYFARYDGRAGKSGIYLVEDGQRRALRQVPGALLTDSRWHDVGFVRTGDQLVMTFDGAPVATVRDATHGVGRVGVGSLDESVYFDDLETLGSGAASGGGEEPARMWDTADEDVAEAEGEWEEEDLRPDLDEGEENLDELTAANMERSDDEGIDSPDALPEAPIRGGYANCAVSGPRPGAPLGGLLFVTALGLVARRRGRRR